MSVHVRRLTLDEIADIRASLERLEKLDRERDPERPRPRRREGGVMGKLKPLIAPPSEVTRLREENERLRQRVEELERQRVEGIVALCVCENAATPRPGCDCVTCTVRRAEERAEAAEAKLAKVVEELLKCDRLDCGCRHADRALAAAKGER